MSLKNEITWLFDYQNKVRPASQEQIVTPKRADLASATSVLTSRHDPCQQ